MMGFLSLLSPGHWMFVGLVALVAFAGGAGSGAWTAHRFDAGPLAEARAATNACTAAREKDIAEANAATTKALTESVASVRAAEADLARLSAKRDAKTATLLEKLAHVPRTTACASSPAIRLYLDSLRKQGPPVPGAY